MAGFYVSQHGMGLYFEDKLGYVRDLETGQEVDALPEGAIKIRREEIIEQLIRDYGADYEEIRQWWQTKPGFYEGYIDNTIDCIYYVNSRRECWILIHEQSPLWSEAKEAGALPIASRSIKYPSMVYYLILERFLAPWNQ